MISIKREGSTVVVELYSSQLNKPVDFRFDTGSDDFAKLLRDSLANDLYDQVEGTRKAEYNSGWKDAKSKKRPKRTWFWTSIKKDAPK